MTSAHSANGGLPGLSVVILTKDRLPLLKKSALSTLKAAELCAFPVEHIVVDNCSLGQSRELQHFCSDHGIKHCRADGTEAAGRNLGLMTATKDHLVFIDDDCIVGELSLLAYANKLESNSEFAAVYGVTEFIGRKSMVFRACQAIGLLRPFNQTSMINEPDWGTTSNVLFSVKALKSVGGFSTDLGAPVGGVDVDVGLKLKEHGYTQGVCANAVAWHTTDTWNSMRATLTRVMNYGLAESALMKKFQARATLNVGLVGLAIRMISACILAFAGLTSQLLVFAVLMSDILFLASGSLVRNRVPMHCALLGIGLLTIKRTATCLSLIRLGMTSSIVKRFRYSDVSLSDSKLEFGRWAAAIATTTAFLL